MDDLTTTRVTDGTIRRRHRYCLNNNWGLGHLSPNRTRKWSPFAFPLNQGEHGNLKKTRPNMAGTRGTFCHLPVHSHHAQEALCLQHGSPVSLNKPRQEWYQHKQTHPLKASSMVIWLVSTFLTNQPANKPWMLKPQASTTAGVIINTY